MTTESGWRFLVEAQKPCLGCVGCKGSEGIQALVPKVFNTCNGTGLVPVLPGLRERCEGCPKGVHHIRWFGECLCEGKRWIAKPKDMPLLLSTMRKAGFALFVTALGWSFYLDNIGDDRYPIVAVINNDNFAACVKAARLAVEARYPQKEKP